MSGLTLDDTGVTALNDILRVAVSQGTIPTTFMAATSPKETLYYAHGGDRIYDHPDAGPVDSDTSEYTGITVDIKTLTKLYLTSVVQYLSATKAATTVG